MRVYKNDNTKSAAAIRFPSQAHKGLLPFPRIYVTIHEQETHISDWTRYLPDRGEERTMVYQIADTAELSAIDSEFQELSRFYSFRNPAEVFSFLQTHPFLTPLLLEAYPQIEERFGPNPEVVLEVITDPEAADDQELFAFIRTDLAPEEALEKLHQLDENWWLDEADRANGKLCIHVEFQ